MYKIQKLGWFFIVCLHILRIHVRSRENRSYGDFNTCFDPHAPSWSTVQLTVKLHSLIQVPTHWTEALHFLDCVSSIVYRSPYFTNDFERRRTFLYCYMCTPFWHLFTFAHRFFSPSFPFLSYFSIIPSLRALLPSSSTLFFFAPHETQLSLCLF